MNHSSPATDIMSGSAPLYSQEPLKTVFTSSTKNLDQDTQSHNKTNSRFPPIKTKADDTPSYKQNTKDVSPTAPLIKKLSEDTANTTNYVFKKPVANVIRKKIDKKKGKGIEIKPQVMEKYRQYIEFLTLVNLTNNLKVQVTEKVPSYVLYVGKGNNSSLIKNLFRTNRPWWTVQETNPDNPSINLHWFQLRQNNILDSFKQNQKVQSDFEGCNYHAEQQSEKVDVVIQEERNRAASRSTHKNVQNRSHSVTQKDLKSSIKFNMTKRSSSKTKGFSQEKASMTQQGIANIGKDVKEELQGEEGKKKKVLANPKMWPIYTNYRRIFSHSQLKQLKKLKIIQEDGKISAKLSRPKTRHLQNRSNYIKMHNHITNNWNLSNKKALFMNLKYYYQAQKINPFEYIPMTFHVTDINDKQFGRFQEEYERRAQVIKQEEKKKKQEQFKYGFKAKKRNAWLVKPGENTNRGTGIEVVQSLEEIKEIIGKDTVDKMGRPRTHILQQYIMPFLYQKRKFDIRCYVCLTSINGYQKGYWYQDGYIRTASKQFNMKNLNNKFIHLTNDAVQKYHEDYSKFQPANKLSYADFQRYLDTVYNANAENGQKLKFYQQAYPEMKKIAADTFRSVYTKINPTKKDFTFEVFGLDFMIDQNFKVWLIQVNTNPCLQLACPLLGRVIPGMLQNAFKLVVDPIFPPPNIEQLVTLSKKTMLPDNLLQTNKFQLIFDQVQEGRQLKALLSTTPEVMIVVQEEDEEYDQNGNECAPSKIGKEEKIE